MHRKSATRLKVFAALLAMLWTAQPASAQLSGFNIKGDVGLKAGSQAPPGGYVTIVFYRYGSDTIKDRFGHEFPVNGDLTIGMGATAFTYVTNKKFIGANYGFAAAPLVILNTAVESPHFGVNPSPGFSDIFVTPISLGWHLKRADVTTGYSIFMPTGHYSAGANDNTGLGMWGHEWSLGSTVFLTENKAWHAATNAAFEFHSKKKDVAAQVGNMLTLEGGLGRNVLKGAGSLGLVYYAQWKISDDTLSGLPALLVQGKNRTFALGPELNIPLATKKTLLGFFALRYQWETYARTTFQGSALTAMFTFLTKPIDLTAHKP